MVADVYKTSPVFIALVVCSQIGGVLKKSKRKREREREVSTRPLIPLWDAIIVRERMQWETTAPRRTTGSEGALIKLKNIVAARLLEHSKDTEAGKTDRETDGGENLATYVHTQEKENHLWERASIWERERERYIFQRINSRREVEMERTQTWVEIVAISVMEINEIIGIVVGGGKKMIARETVDPLWILLPETRGVIAGWLTSFFIPLGGINGRGN